MKIVKWISSFSLENKTILIKKQKAIDVHFQKAIDYISSGSVTLSPSMQLKFYGWYKTALYGPCRISMPLQPLAFAKWKAWKNVSSLCYDEARNAYMQAVVAIALQDTGSSTLSSGMGMRPSQMKDAVEEEEDNENENQFHYAKVGKIEELKTMSECILDWNLQDEGGRTMLHWAVDADQTEVMEWLLSQDYVNVNAKDEDGFTPLAYAVSCEHIELVLLLCNAGANVSVMDNDGDSISSMTRNNAIIKILLDFNPK